MWEKESARPEKNERIPPDFFPSLQGNHGLLLYV